MPCASSTPAPLFVEGRPVPGTRYRVLRRHTSCPRRAEVEHVERGGRFTLVILPAAACRFDMPRRLMNEWQRLAALAHPGIARVTDAGVAPDGFAFCVLAEFDGSTLAERCASEGRLCAVEALGVAASVLSALGAAHGIGVVHGGVCPQNVFVDARGKVQLAGFGVAKLERAPAALRYAAPEQRAGRPLGLRADVYSAGLLLLEMLTGEQPSDFTGSSIASFVAKRAAGLPPELGALLGEMLAPDPRARPPSAARIAARLRRLAAALRIGSIAEDAPTRHAGYDAPTAPGPACAATPTDVVPRAPWLDAEAALTRPDGLAARRGSGAARSPSAASPPDTTTLVALPAASVAAPAVAPSTAAARAAGISRRARGALAACVTLACCLLLVCPWLGRLRAFAAPGVSAAARASAASRPPPPPTPARASHRRAHETLASVLVLDRQAARPARVHASTAHRSAQPPHAAAFASTSARHAKPRWAPDIPPNPYLPSSGL